MKPTKQTEVITDMLRGGITINGDWRHCYYTKRGYRCALSAAHVRALGVEPIAGESYELLDGWIIRCQSGPGRDGVVELPLPSLGDQGSSQTEPVTTFLDPAPEPLSPPRAPRPPRGPSRKYAALVAAARELVPLLPEGHRLRRALDRLDD